MDSSCVPAGTSYLLAFGFGIAAIALSSWLVLLMRAIYRDDKGFRRGLMNAAPLWVVGVTGVIALFASGGSLREWADSCFPETWSALGGAIIGIGLASAMTAIVRLVLGRIRVGRTSEPGENTLWEAAADPAAADRRQTSLPPERRRVIVEYSLTYGAAVVVIIVGVGLLWA